jgi:4-carboxymuconolactone decarboxylase
MTRLAPLDPAALSPRQKEVYDAIVAGPRKGVRGPLAMWLHRPDLCDTAQALGAYCRFGTSLPPRLSELAILVSARIWRAEFEWQAHKPIAIEAGVSPAAIEAIRTHGTPSFEKEDEAVVYDFALSMQRDRTMPQALYERGVRTLGEAAVVDLTGILGYYALVSMTLAVFDVDPLKPKRELD